MKLRTKNVWNKVVPLRLRGSSASRFACFQKLSQRALVQGFSRLPKRVRFDSANGYVYWAGLGIFHTGVEVHGVEYAFGAHDYPTSGVFEVEPRQCPGFRFRKSIFMGTASLDPFQVREFMERQSANYNGDTYHLIVKNCNHFCEDICYKLTGNHIPKWVNRLARIGSFCNCILPEALKATTVSTTLTSKTRSEEAKNPIHLPVVNLIATKRGLNVFPISPLSLQRLFAPMGI